MIRTALLCDQARTASELQAALQREGLMVLGTVDRPETLASSLTEWAPEAVAVVEPFGGVDSAGALRMVRHLCPDAAVVVMTRPGDPNRVRHLFRSGADDVLIGPREAAALPNALRNAVQAWRVAAGAQGGKVVAVWSPKGGVGCSLLAANLAMAAQTREGRATLLVDLGGPYGSADMYLGLRPERNLGDLLRVMHELNPAQLAQACTEHPGGLLVLAAGQAPEPAAGLLPEHMAPLTRVCRRVRDLTILDVPSAWTPVAQAALGAADRIILVVTPDAPAVRVAQAAVRLLPPAGRMTAALVVNRASRRAELGADAVGELIGLPVIATVRADFAGLEPLINTGTPLVAGAAARTRRPLVAADVAHLARRLS